jgi:transcriptional regulator with XRE-family HTH domain
MTEKRRQADELPGAIAIARSFRGWNQGQLARASGLGPSSLSDYERGVKTPSLRSLQRIAAALGVSVADLFQLASLVRRFRGGEPAAEGAGRGAAAINPGDLPEIGRELVALLRTEVEQAAQVAPPAHLIAFAESRRQAPALWARLEGLSHAQRRTLVRQAPELHDAGLCELLCERSVETAGDSADRAFELASLAVLVAERVAGRREWRSRLQGYARMHLANALRVKGKLPRAARALARASQLWEAGATDDPGLLNEARVLHLEASLHRDQRRLPEALALIEQALAIDSWGETAALLIGKAKALEEAGEFEQAIAWLERAAAQLEGERDARKLFFVRKNTAVNLCHLGRHAEAERRLPGIRSMASSLHQELELVRLAWLEGRVAAGRGRPGAALAALERVRGRFVELEIAYDAALVTLELAEVHASLGHTAEVVALARESAPIFASQGVHREAQAALDLFRQAADREAATAELLRRLILYLYRARHDPQLRFEAAP